MGSLKQFLCFFTLPEGSQWRKYWLAETIRLQEELSGRFDDQAANSEVRAKQLPFAQALVERAYLVAQQQQIEAVQQRWIASWRLLLTIGLVVCAVVGFSSPIAFLSNNKEPVNLLYANLLLLGPVSAALVLWLVLNLWRGSQHSVMAETMARLVERWHGTKSVAPLGPGLLSFLQHQHATQWLFGAITHVAWLVVMTAAWLALLLMLIVQDYGFYWGSTLLTGEQIAPFVMGVGAPAEWLGLPMPTLDLIVATGEGAQWGPEAKFRWGTWLLWVVWLVGWCPRLLLFFYALVRLWLMRQPKPLPVGARWTALEKMITAGAQHAISVQATDGSNDTVVATAQNNSSQTGRNAWVGYELGSEAISPEADATTMSWHDVGTLREQREVVSALTLEPQGVRRVLLVCHGQRTPEKALRRFIEQLSIISYELGVMLVPENELSEEQLQMWRTALAQHAVTWVDEFAWLEGELNNA